MTTILYERSGVPGSVESDGRPLPPGFLSAYPGYRSTMLLDRLRATEYSYLDASGHVYLDYTGAGLPAQAQLSAHAERIRGGCFGNPHSESPASAASTELVERARLAVLAHFNAPPEEYTVIFTPNATGACRLVGEAYPFGPRTRLILTCDNHNSVNGIREFARSRGAITQYVPFCSPELRVDDDAIRQALARPRPGPLGGWRLGTTSANSAWCRVSARRTWWPATVSPASFCPARRSGRTPDAAPAPPAQPSFRPTPRRRGPARWTSPATFTASLRRWRGTVPSTRLFRRCFPSTCCKRCLAQSSSAAPAKAARRRTPVQSLGPCQHEAGPQLGGYGRHPIHKLTWPDQRRRRRPGS